MQALAVVVQKPGAIVLDRLPLDRPAERDITVDVAWSGVSTGTERLLFTGDMPPFPGMGYPLVPGYESVGRVVNPGGSGLQAGQLVFVPGARCFGAVRGLFGGAASRLVVPAERVTPIGAELGADAVLLALAATAHHALAAPASLPDLIIGHGVLGRLLARLTIALGGAAPSVWDTNPDRRDPQPYPVLAPDDDERRDYRAIYDVSGSPAILDTAVQRLAHGGEIVLAGFYAAPLSLAFPPAFMREARFRISAEWRQPDMTAILDLIGTGRLSLDGLVTHRRPAAEAPDAYATAFTDPACLKMVLDWSACA